jgi:hypothetical protein
VVYKEPFRGDDGGWNTPQRDARREEVYELDHTLDFTSPQSTQSGWHPNILSCDDMVDTKNSGIGVKPEVRRHVIDVFDTNKNTLDPLGYLYLTGTRYHPFDLYGKRLEDMDPTKWEVLIRPSIIVKSGERLVPGEFPAEKGVELVFGDLPGMNYSRMRELFYENYETFMCQQQNDPQGGNVPTFTERLWSSCVIEEDRIPEYDGEVYLYWRIAYAGRKHMSHTEGIAARVLDGRVYVLDAWRINRVPSSTAEFIVDKQKEYQADGVTLFNTPGSENMYVEIRNQAARRNVSMRLGWAEWEDNNDRLNAEIKKLEPLMKVGRLLFSTGMSKAAECRKQFVHFGLVEEIGIIDCVSKFADLVPMSQMRASM